MQELEETWLNLQTTRARMEARLPEIRVHALRSLPLTHEDKTVSLKAGEEWKQRIADSSPLRLGDFAEVVIDGGRAEPVLQDDEKRLAGRVEFLLKKAEAESLAEARLRTQKYEEWMNTRKQREETRKTLLGGRSEEDFQTEVAALEMQLKASPESASNPNESDGTAKALEEEQHALTQATEKAKEVQAAFEAARQRVADLRERSVGLDAKLEMLGETERELLALQASDSSVETDESQSIEEARSKVAALGATHLQIREELREMGAAEPGVQLESLRATHGVWISRFRTSGRKF